MLVWKHGRGLLAGMGVTGSLLAAVAAGFALTGGILGFNSWPSAGPATADRALRVASPSPRSERVAPLTLPAPPAGRPAPAAGPLLTTGGGVRAAPVKRRRSTTRAPRPATSPAHASPDVVAGEPVPAATAPAAPAQSAAARLVTGTTGSAAAAVRSVSPQAATVVDAAGQTVAGLVGP